MLNSNFNGYDAWKLSSPYDHEVLCKDCGEEAENVEQGERPLCSECKKEY